MAGLLHSHFSYSSLEHAWQHSHLHTIQKRHTKIALDTSSWSQVFHTNAEFSCEKEGNGTAFKCCSLEPRTESHSSSGTSGGTAGGSRAEGSHRRLLCLYCSRFHQCSQQLRHRTLTAKMQVAYSQQSSAHSPKTLLSPLHWFAL